MNGFVKFRESRFQGPPNPPTTGGTAAPDPRVEEMATFIDSIRFEHQRDALTPGMAAQALREQNIGAYNAALKIKARFLKLFGTAQPVPIVDEPGGDTDGQG